MQSDHHIDVEPLERRRETRKKALIHAFVSDRTGNVDLKCVIRDISKGGCRIASSYIEDLPGIIEIVPEGFDRPMTGKIVWRSEKFAGVQFLSEAELTVFDAQHPKRKHDPRPAGFFSRLYSLAGLRRRSGISSRDEARPQPGRHNYGLRVLHGLQKPLSALKSLLGLLQGDAVRPIPRRARSVLSAARRNAEKAELLVEEALHAEKIEGGQLPCHPRELDIVELARNSALANTGFAAKYDVRLEVRDEAGTAKVEADPLRMDEVLTQLISCAAKFSPVGETVSVSVARIDHAIRVSVSDKGAGSNVWHGDADGKHLNRNDDDDDLGIGLDICHSILERHGTRLRFDSRPGSGTTVWFELPEIK